MIDRPIDIRILNVKGKFVDFKYRSSNSRSRMPKEQFRKKVSNDRFNVENIDMFQSKLQKAIN